MATFHKSIFPRLVTEPITRRQFVDPSKLKEFADDNLEFDENDRNLSKQVVLFP